MMEDKVEISVEETDNKVEVFKKRLPRTTWRLVGEMGVVVVI